MMGDAVQFWRQERIWRSDNLRLRGIVAAFLAGALTLFSPTARQAEAAAEVSLAQDLQLATDALLMPISAPYGRSINGVSFQTEPFLTYNGYQYAAWYRARGTTNEDFILARRDLDGTTWETFDTDEDLANGDNNWDAHDVISMGISGDGRMHFSWDMHNNPLKFMNSATGVATTPGGTWDATILSGDRNSLNVGGAAIADVTYPQFITKPNGDLLFVYRTGSSGNGNVFLSNYSATTGVWATPHQVINGTNSLIYTDPVNTSDNRNAYLNGVDIGPDGSIHVTWTWREEATGGSNHDIMYAYSEDGGDTWRNNAGAVVGTLATPMNLNSPGINVVNMDRTNTLMNQQTQAVDLDGRVHAIMWHKKDGLPPQTSPAFTTTPSAYFHYFRDPATGSWTRRDLPTERLVGSRPDMAYDAEGNVFAVYVSPGAGDGVGVINYYTEGDLIIAGATKAANYTDWTILHTDTRDFAGEPFIDQQRLLQQGILSILIQENSDAITGRTGTPLHILEYNVAFADPLAGDYNDDGVVDAADYNVWRDQLGQDIAMEHETVTLGSVTSDDYDVWKAHFGAGSAAGAGGNASPGNAIPEPTAGLLFLAAVSTGLLRRRRTC